MICALWLQELFSRYFFLERPMKGGDILAFQKGGKSQKRGGYDPPYELCSQGPPLKFQSPLKFSSPLNLIFCIGCHLKLVGGGLLPWSNNLQSYNSISFIVRELMTGFFNLVCLVCSGLLQLVLGCYFFDKQQTFTVGTPHSNGSKSASTDQQNARSIAKCSFPDWAMMIYNLYGTIYNGNDDIHYGQILLRPLLCALCQFSLLN